MCEIEEQTKFYNSKAEKTGWRDFIRLDFINLTAFTMAEILISLTIIGIIAAITLPSLKANINEKTWATQRKALYSRMSQAISMMPSLNGYGVVMNSNGTINNTETANKATQAFINEGLSKVLSIKNVCDNQNFKKCNMPDKITNQAGSKIDTPRRVSELNATIPDSNSGVASYMTNSYAAAFEVVNGEAVAVYYNPKCISGEIVISVGDGGGTDGVHIKQYVCANFIYDLNGRKGPNKVGKDVGFMTAIYPTDSELVSVIPVFYSLKHNSMTKKWDEAKRYCRELDKDYRLPNVNEALALYYNQNLFTYDNQGWTSSSIDLEHAWYVSIGGINYIYSKDSNKVFTCVKH